jgi:hypothetical protein
MLNLLKVITGDHTKRNLISEEVEPLNIPPHGEGLDKDQELGLHEETGEPRKA